MRKPHRLTDEDMGEIILGPLWREVASATTSDSSHRKRLEVAVGSAEYRVGRRSLISGAGWDVVYEGDDPKKAQQAYNRLS